MMLTFFLASPFALSDNRTPIGKFEKRSLKIGEPVKFSLSWWHDKKIEAFFPDTNYNYSPFEIISKEYYPTRTTGSKSLDSAVYLIRTFNIDRTIHYALPVFIVNELGDTLVITSGQDSVSMIHLVQSGRAGALKTATPLHRLDIVFNYRYYILLFFVAVGVMVALFFFFRRPIIRRIKLYYIRQGHQSFIANFEKLEKDFSGKHELGVMEKAVSLWKDYLSRLENIPINTYTTTEIISMFKNKELVEGLQIIDRSIYRGSIGEDSEKALIILRRFSNSRYQQIKKRIINE